MPPIRCWRSPKVEVREGSLSGRGVFATEAIPAGHVVAVKTGHVVNRNEVWRLTDTIGDQALQIDDDLYLSPRTSDEVEQTSIRMNHSCNANVGFRGQVIYVAMKNISPNDIHRIRRIKISVNFFSQIFSPSAPKLDLILLR